MTLTHNSNKFELHKSKYVAPYIELWSSLIQIMDLRNRIMEPHKSILGPK